MLVRLTPDLTINASEISSMCWERDGGMTRLTIVMNNGTRHTIEHRPSMLDGPDCYKIEQQIFTALES